MFASLGPAPEKVKPRFSILAHQLRRRFSSDYSLPKEKPDRPTRRSNPKIASSFDPSSLAWVLSSCEPFPGQNRPMFHGPSWTDLSCVPLCASGPKTFSAASRLRKISSSGASYRLASHPLRRAFASPAGGDRTFGHLPPRSPLPVPGEAGTAVPIT